MSGLQLYNTIWIIVYAYLARFLVLAVRPTISGLHQIDRSLEEAAQVAGAELLYRMRTIIFPLVAPATLAGGILIFMTAFSELTVSALLWASGSETIGVVIFSFEQGGDSNYAAAISVLTVALTFILMLLTSLLRAASSSRSAPMAGLEINNVSKTFRPDFDALDQRFAGRAGWRVRSDPRTFRLWQDDVAAPDRGLRESRPKARLQLAGI